MKINLYKILIDVCFKKFVRILKIEVWINNFIEQFVKNKSRYFDNNKS